MPLTLGFDTARRLLSEVAGNIFVDALSSNKYWHFIRCGEDALTVEVALQTRSTFSVLTMGRQAHHISDSQKETLTQTVNNLCEVVQSRRRSGRYSGVVLISRQLIETLPEMDQLKAEIAAIVKAEAAGKNRQPFPTEVDSRLKSDATKALFKRLPRFVQMSMIRNRDSSGLPVLPKDLEAERILGRFVQQELRNQPPVKKVKATFAPRFHAMDLMTSSPLSTAYHYSLLLSTAPLGMGPNHSAPAVLRTGLRTGQNSNRACWLEGTLWDTPQPCLSTSAEISTSPAVQAHPPIDCLPSRSKVVFGVGLQGMHRNTRYWEPCAIPFTYLYPEVRHVCVYPLWCEPLTGIVPFFAQLGSCFN
ncbi:PFP-BETA1 [Symbiodinium sp. CCMP2456]|nr:PFP-BETA1 [Symbiodinium sp. CCMP2456]